MTATSTASIQRAPPRQLRIAVGLIAALDLAMALTVFHIAYSWSAAPSPAEYLVNARLAAHPVFALAALGLAIAGRLRAALIVLAASIIAGWLCDLVALMMAGVDGNVVTPSGNSPMGWVVFPLLAAAAIVLAVKNTWLWLAAVFVALPPLFDFFGIGLFAIAVMIFGFGHARSQARLRMRTVPENSHAERLLRIRGFPASGVDAGEREPLDVLQGKFAFDWHGNLGRQKCAKVDGRLLADFNSASYRCDLKAVTNTASGAPARMCTQANGKKEYLIFDTLRACENERKTQESNE